MMLVALCVIILVIVIVVPIVIVKSVHEDNNINQGLQCPEAALERVDCYPEKDGNTNEGTCHDRGCCWVEDGPAGAPYCFFPASYGYDVKDVRNTDVGMTVLLQKNDSQLPYPV